MLIVPSIVLKIIQKFIQEHNPLFAVQLCLWRYNMTHRGGARRKVILGTDLLSFGGSHTTQRGKNIGRTCT